MMSSYVQLCMHVCVFATCVHVRVCLCIHVCVCACVHVHVCALHFKVVCALDVHVYMCGILDCCGMQ